MNFNKENISASIMQLSKNDDYENNPAILRQILNFIDLTSLNTTDHQTKIIELVEKVNNFQHAFPDCPNVAAICVYPNFAKTVREHLQVKEVNIATVAGCFPSSQSFLSVKLSEVSLAVEKGADEVDIVLSVGKFLNKEYQEVADEIALIKTAAGEAHLKVILETGVFPDEESIYTASMLSMESGADFIKTSTGKVDPAATYDAVYIMTNAIKEFYEKTGKIIGIKPAGGIVTVKQALVYYSIVEHVLGKSWLNNKYFRIGASRLANNILTHLHKINGIKTEVKYF